MGSSVFRMILVSGACFVLGPLLAAIRMVPPLVGFWIFAFSGLLSLIGLLGGLVGLVRGRGGGIPTGAAGLIVLVFLVAALPGRGLPRINDITTDTENAPAFRHAGTLPGNVGRDMTYPGTAFAEQQKVGYPDLQGLSLSAPPAQVFERVVVAAADLPNSEVTFRDPAARIVEGVTTSRLFRFQDDFVIEVRESGNGSVVHMRSKSRVGRGDIGANAARIRALFAKLE